MKIIKNHFKKLLVLDAMNLNGISLEIKLNERLCINERMIQSLNQKHKEVVIFQHRTFHKIIQRKSKKRRKKTNVKMKIQFLVQDFTLIPIVIQVFRLRTTQPRFKHLTLPLKDSKHQNLWKLVLEHMEH